MGCCRPAGRRALVVAALLASACGDETKSPAVAPASASAPRDILLLTLDTTRADRLGCYGNGRGLTPNLDQFAREGTLFEQAMAPMPCTGPAHAALFTGLSPRFHGVSSNYSKASDSLVTLAERLHEQGFATAAFFNTFDFAELKLVQGFDGFGFDPGRKAEKIVPGFENFWRGTAGKRRFCWIHLFITHAPYELPARFDRFVEHAYSGPLGEEFATCERIRRGELVAPPDYVAHFRDRYDAAIACLDEKVGEIRAVLAQTGTLETTLWATIGDHGEGLEPPVIGLHAPSISEATLHVPFLLRGPGVPAGRRVGQLVQHMDLLPTLFGALALPLPTDIEGRDLSPLLVAAGPAGGLAAVEWERRCFAVLPTRFEGKQESDAESAAVRQGSLKLVLHGGGRRELFDLSSDPAEAHDLTADRPDAVRALAAAFAEWSREPAARSGGTVSPEMQQELKKLGYE